MGRGRRGPGQRGDEQAPPWRRCLPSPKALAPTFPQGIGQSVGRLKFGSVRELLEAGYHALLFDLDLAILQDPFASMLPPR